MKKKDIKAFAKKIIEAEKILQTSENAEDRKKAEKTIEDIAKKCTSFEDLMELDEYVYNALQRPKS